MSDTKSSRDVLILAEDYALCRSQRASKTNHHRDQDQDSTPISLAATAACVALDVGFGEGQALRLYAAVGHDGPCRRLLVDDVTSLEVEVEVDTIGHLL